MTSMGLRNLGDFAAILGIGSLYSLNPRWDWGLRSLKIGMFIVFV